MSDEEIEEFEINDYDLKHAMNPNFKRSRMTKEDAMLGIWSTSGDRGDSEDDSNDDIEGFSNRKRSRGSKNILFVSGDVKGKEKKNNDDDDDGGNNDDEDSNAIGSDSDNEDVNLMLNELNRQDAERKALKNKIKKDKPIRQQYKGKFNDDKQKNIGEWEQHTKGIGMKLLQKMGWEKGKGIGKDLQGRVKPIEAVLRKGKGAIGLYGSEGTEKNKIVVEEIEEIEIKGKKKIPEQAPQWRNSDQKKKPKYLIKTVDEILSGSNDFDNEDSYRVKIQSKSSIIGGVSTSKIKIIDMTGREQKILHGYESLSNRHNRPDDEDEISKDKKKLFDLPELLHNLDLLVNMTEEKIFHSDKQFKYNEDMILSMMHEEKRINEKIDEEKRHIDRMNNLLELIENCESKVKSGIMDIDDVIEIFKNIKLEYYNEYKIYNLSDLSLPLIIPIINKYYSNWNPFLNENKKAFFYDKFKELKEILEDSTTLSSLSYKQQKQQQMNSFHRLLWESWMPSIRLSLLNYNIKNCINVIDFIELWSSIVPNWIIQNILEQLIIPKLNTEVENWNPLTDTIPIHAWIHPWLPLLKERLEPLYAPIRYKLSNALINWHPSDNSAKAILSPWKNVFTTNSWDLFMINNILPKLEKCLNDFEINPIKQTIEPWKWIMSWEDLVPNNNFVNLVDKLFFPKWLNVLSIWLNSSPNYDEVSSWYLGWKKLFSEKLINNSSIKSKLTQGLLMMNKSANGGAVSYSPINTQPSGPSSSATTMSPLMSNNLLDTVQTTATPSITSFKDIIEKKATEHNLLFLPVPNRSNSEGKQIYRLGNINVYIDRNVIFYLNNGIWTPTSLNEIIKSAI